MEHQLAKLSASTSPSWRGSPEELHRTGLQLHRTAAKDPASASPAWPSGARRLRQRRQGGPGESLVLLPRAWTPWRGSQPQRCEGRRVRRAGEDHPRQRSQPTHTTLLTI